MNTPEDYPLRFAHHYPEIVSKLAALPRTGWVQWHIVNPETVWEHILATRQLAVTYKKHLALSEEEFLDLLAMIEIHDWPEALVGDEVILGDEQDVDDLRKSKQVRELAAMKELCTDTTYGEQIFTLFQRFEENEDAVASFANQLEKLQAVIRAAEYEYTQATDGITAEFIQYTKQSIQDPFLTSELTRLAKQHI